MAQVFAAVFFGNCVFLAILHSVVSQRREKYLDAVLDVLQFNAHDYVDFPGVDVPKRVEYDFPIKRIGIRNSTFPLLADLVTRELETLKQFIANDSEMYSTCTRLKILDTDLGKAVSANFEFDMRKEENLKYHWERYDLCYKTLERLHFCVARVLCIPAVLVTAFALMLASTDLLATQGNLAAVVLFAVASAVLGLAHTVYMAAWAVRESHRITVQKEKDSQEQFQKEKREYMARMKEKLQQMEAENPGSPTLIKPR
jgi:hypothetical protein